MTLIETKPTIGCTFPKGSRLRKRKEFTRLTSFGGKVENHNFIMRYAPAPCVLTRMGVTVTKRVGNAIIRNRLKRLSRECFRLQRHRLNCHMDINIIAKRSAARATSQTLFLALQQLFNKIQYGNDH